MSKPTPQTDALIAQHRERESTKLETLEAMEAHARWLERRSAAWAKSARCWRDEAVLLTTDLARVTAEREELQACAGQALAWKAVFKALRVLPAFQESDLGGVPDCGCNHALRTIARLAALRARNSELVALNAGMANALRELRKHTIVEYRNTAGIVAERVPTVFTTVIDALLTRAESPTPVKHVPETDFGNITLPNAAIKGGAK